jgi:adenylate kinase
VRLILVGPPGAGKGTQARFIASYLSVPKISTGDIFRANVSAGTPLGVEARKFMDAGDLVPDEVTVGMVRDRLAEDDAAEGFLLDGFPRNLFQAKVLDDLLGDLGQRLDVVLELVVNDDEVVRRISGRRTCRSCENAAIVEPDRPAPPCEKCGGELFQRDDDKSETVRHRLEVYAAQTAPLVGYYSERDMLEKIDAMGTVDEVTQRALEVLRRYQD